MTSPRPERARKLRKLSSSPAVPRSQNGANAAANGGVPVATPTGILETAAAAGRFETFGRAIRATSLAALLTGKGPFTVFAPTDKAFAKMPPADLEALLKDVPELTRVLSYHVVAERVRAPRAGSPRSSGTASGANLEISRVDGGGFRVNDARILKTNIRASNGVIHAIDSVLVPA